MISDLYPEVLATIVLFLGVWMVFPSSAWSRVPVRFAVVLLFQFLNFRYVSWRFKETLVPLTTNPESIWIWFFLAMEMCSTVLLAWHFILLIKPSDRTPEADKAEDRLKTRQTAPGVDVLIPTYNEPAEILRRTILAATRLEYPDFKISVLDDGARPWLEAMCRDFSIGYVVRPDRKGFKAGNLNHAIKNTQKPLISVIDADFAVEPNFLMRTVGLLDAPDVGIVQTPQIFLNPDAIQYNLGGEKAWPEAQCMFTDVMQSCRDTWNNAFCYGTSFVIKRECLERSGGFPEETITEDLHSTYVLLALGYKTRFLNEKLSSGLATQDIGEFVNQRTRWGIGTLQCLVTPRGALRAKGLSLLDRVFFLDPVLYYIGTLWTLCLLAAPALYWWFGISPFHSDYGQLLVVLGPRMLLSVYGLYMLSSKKNLPFVTEIGRIVGLVPFLRAVWNLLMNPRSQIFSVTKKELSLSRSLIYWRILWPPLALLLLTSGGMLMNFFGLHSDLAFLHRDVGLMISLSLYSLWLLFFSCLACVQKPIPGGQLQSRITVRNSSARVAVWALLKRMLLSR